MRRTISWLAVLALPAVLLLGPPAAAQQLKKGAVDKDLDDKNSEKMIKAGVLVGRVVSVYEGSRKIKLAVSVPIQSLNPGALTTLQQAQAQLALSRARRDLNGMRQAQMSLVRAQLDLYRVEVHSLDVDVEARDDVVVRTARPKVDFDDKGRVKKLSKAELKELKGPDPKLPGYKAEFADLGADQIIQVQLVRKKETPGEARPKVKAKPKAAAKSKGKAKGKEDAAAAPDAAELTREYTAQVSRIVILGEAAGAR